MTSVKRIKKYRKRTGLSGLITILGIMATIGFFVLYPNTPRFALTNVDSVLDQKFRTIPNTSTRFSDDNSSMQNTFVDAEQLDPPGPFSKAHFYQSIPFYDGGHMSSLPALFDDVASLDAFRRSVTNGNSAQLTGIWVEDTLAFRVQAGLTTYAPTSKDTLSIYRWAWEHGVMGLLIHNYRGGTKLYQLNPGIMIAAIYGDGEVDWYVTRGGTWYEAQTYSSRGFTGPFRIWSCGDCDFDISVQDIRWRHYAGTPHLAFQTCVETADRVGLVIIDAYFVGTPPSPQEADENLETLKRIQFELLLEPKDRGSVW